MSYTIWQDHLAHGAQVRIEAYPDRLRVTNPGGLHGEISRTRLFSEPLTSSRNSHLARRTSTNEDTRGGARHDPSGSAQATPKDGGDRRGGTHRAGTTKPAQPLAPHQPARHPLTPRSRSCRESLVTARGLTRETDPASRDTGAPTSAGCAASRTSRTWPTNSGSTPESSSDDSTTNASGPTTAATDSANGSNSPARRTEHRAGQ